VEAVVVAVFVQAGLMVAQLRNVLGSVFYLLCAHWITYLGPQELRRCREWQTWLIARRNEDGGEDQQYHVSGRWAIAIRVSYQLSRVEMELRRCALCGAGRELRGRVRRKRFL